MIDLKLDNRGDLVLKEPERLPRLCVEFRPAEYPLLNIQFMQEKPTENRKAENENTLNVVFKTSGKEEDFSDTLTTDVVHGEDETKQHVMNWLRTESGEIPLFPDIGSRLQQFKHLDIMDTKVQEGISSLLESELSAFIDNVSVEITHETYDGNFYSQNITIKVYSGDDLAYTTTL